jgi:hypothetical protein
MEHDRLTKQIRGISAALSAFGAAYGKRTGAPIRFRAAADIVRFFGATLFV